MKQFVVTKELHSFTPAQSLFPKHHTGFIDINGHLLWSLAGSCADGTGSSQETAPAKTNLRHLGVCSTGQRALWDKQDSADTCGLQ